MCCGGGAAGALQVAQTTRLPTFGDLYVTEPNVAPQPLPLVTTTASAAFPWFLLVLVLGALVTAETL